MKSNAKYLFLFLTSLSYYAVDLGMVGLWSVTFFPGSPIFSFSFGWYFRVWEPSHFLFDLNYQSIIDHSLFYIVHSFLILSFRRLSILDGLWISIRKAISGTLCLLSRLQVSILYNRIHSSTDLKEKTPIPFWISVF